MKQLLEQALVDCSTERAFCYSLQCGQCGEIWKSKPIAFSKAGDSPSTEEKRIVYEAMYQRERAWAKMLAVKQALEHFNLCPICKRLVCDHCFLICSDLDMCCGCAGRLKERGEPVSACRDPVSNGAAGKRQLHIRAVNGCPPARLFRQIKK